MDRSTKTMRAIVRDPSGVCLVEREVPRPAREWVRMRVLLAGICRTDLYAAEGRIAIGASRVLGHELVGEIDAAGDGLSFTQGERVIASPLIACGTCSGCIRAERCARPRMLGV